VVLAWPHWVIVPIVLPLMMGSLLVLVERRSLIWTSRLSLIGVLGLLAVSVGLLGRAQTDEIQAYLVGNWQAPWGIALALDRLSATMVLLTAIVGLATLLYARGGDDRRGASFHALFQYQLMGLNGAFLTADLFNLFVFFEVLLIASYGLLLHGAGRERLKNSVHYVTFNLTGSALFLIAVSLLYGLTGTLNMADLAERITALPSDRVHLAETAALLLLVVFCVKAALLPLYFWLPGTYGSATAPVAALFAIMTKVGVYAVLRATTLMFGADAGLLEQVAAPWLTVLAIATLVLGAIGALAARHLRTLVAYGVVVSAGTLLVAVSLAHVAAISAALFYLINSTLVAAAMFLLADRISAARGGSNDLLAPATIGAARVPLAVAFVVLAVASAGLPPLAGFLGKALVLQAAGVHTWATPVIAAILASSLLLVVAYGRAGSALFWESHLAVAAPAASATVPMPGRPTHDLAIGLLMGLLVACAVFAGPLGRHLDATAGQLFSPALYRAAVLGAQPVPPAFDVRREMREAGLVKGDDLPPPRRPPVADAAPAVPPSALPALPTVPVLPAPPASRPLP
jgi:multicomponent K+:H+ antiporter subunit D